MHICMVDAVPHQEDDLYAFVIGATISQMREKHRWTQGELAQRVGLGQPTISRIEHGVTSPDAHQMRALATAFGMTPAELNGVIDDAFSRAKEAAKSSVKGPLSGDWWKTALALIGAVGLVGLAGFAVALALKEAERSAKPKLEDDVIDSDTEEFKKANA
jgi:transcriptional regulator with XRE-family HTH domain